MSIGQSIKLIPLGGLGELGKNMMIVCVGDDWVIIDSGSAMPEDGMLGIDVVIPDVSILLENQDKIKGLILTHGHEDHIGALPYLLEQLNLPVYGTKLTLAMARFYLNEYDYFEPVQMNTIEAGKPFMLGQMLCELIHVNHDIGDACGVAIKTEMGWIIHTGDFKVDYTPVDGKRTDLDRFGTLGREGVLVLLSDSVNAEYRGSTLSEKAIGEQLSDMIRHAPGRVIIHLYITDLVRVQQVLTIAEETGRRVSIPTEQLLNVMERAESAGCLTYSRHNVASAQNKNHHGNVKSKPGIVLLASIPGEPYLSPLSGESGQRFPLEKDDTVILTGSYHAGTEKTFIRTIDMLYRQGAEQVYDLISRNQISSHAGQDELKLVLSLTNPKYFIPIHGEMRHMMQHKYLAEQLGWQDEDIFILTNGEVLEFSDLGAAITDRVPAEKVLVDGLGVGDIGNVVLKDRKLLAQDGVVIVALALKRRSKQLVGLPELITRGFVYTKESEALMDEVRQKLADFVRATDMKNYDPALFRGLVKDAVSKMLFEKTRRRPMVLPVILDI